MSKTEAGVFKNKLLTSLRKEGLSIVGESLKNFHYELIVSDGKERNNINIFFGKKGVTPVLQGKTGTSLHFLLSEIIGKPVTEKKSDLIPENYIGSDESGKGDFFGPLVVCAVYLNGELEKKIKNSGVQDSKNLSPAQIKSIALELIEKLDGNFAVRLVEPEKYNRLYSEIKNLNLLLEDMHKQVITELLVKSRPKQIIIDQFSSKKITFPEFPETEVIQRTKAEEFPAVAAASIIARYNFDEWFNRKKESGIDLPKGASSIVDSVAKQYYKTFGEDFFNKNAKMHFKSYMKIFS